MFSSGSNEFDAIPGTDITLAAAKGRLSELLHRYDLEQYVTIDTVERWCREAATGKRSTTDIMSLLAGLAGDILKLPALQGLINAAMDFYNVLPQPALSGKSPREKSADAGFGSRGFSTEEREVGGRDFMKLVTDAHSLISSDYYPAAVEKFNTVFATLLEQKTVRPDIYRLFANAAVAHFGAGLEVEGSLLLDKSLELNPNYDFAIMTKKKYDRGDFAMLVLRGRVERLSKSSQNAERWDLEPIRSEWSTSQIIKQLAVYGIKTNKNEFIKVAKKYFSTDDLVEEEWYLHYTGPDDWHEDFVWMACYALWERWCTSWPAVDILESTFADLNEAVFSGDNKVDTAVDKMLDVLQKYLSICHPEFITVWKSSYHYATDVTSFLDSVEELLTTAQRMRILELASGFQKLTGDNFWRLARIMDKALYQEADWRAEIEEFFAEFPYTPLPFLFTARQQFRQKNKSAEEKYMRRALAAAERREKEHPGSLSYNSLGAFDDQKQVLELLADFYRDYKVKNKLKNINHKLKSIRKRQETDNKDVPWLEKGERMVREAGNLARRRMLEGLAMKYFAFLQDLGINFKTAELTQSELIAHGFGDQRKIGRNDPCLCGSGRKYKKCHGK